MLARIRQWLLSQVIVGALDRAIAGLVRLRRKVLGGQWSPPGSA